MAMGMGGGATKVIDVDKLLTVEGFVRVIAVEPEFKKRKEELSALLREVSEKAGRAATVEAAERMRESAAASLEKAKATEAEAEKEARAIIDQAKARAMQMVTEAGTTADNLKRQLADFEDKQEKTLALLREREKDVASRENGIRAKEGALERQLENARLAEERWGKKLAEFEKLASA